MLCYIDRSSKFREWNFGSSSSHSGIETAGDYESRPLALLCRDGTPALSTERCTKKMHWEWHLLFVDRMAHKFTPIDDAQD